MEELKKLLSRWGSISRMKRMGMIPDKYEQYLVTKDLLGKILKKISEVRDERISEHLAGERGCPTVPYEETTLEVIKFSWYHTPFLKVTAYLPSRPKNDKAIKYRIG